MPTLAALYHLQWSDLQAMPFAEIGEHISQLADVRRLLGQVEMVTFRDA